jgi:hypothetical protein
LNWLSEGEEMRRKHDAVGGIALLHFQLMGYRLSLDGVELST